MDIGINIRAMGVQSTPDIIRTILLEAEQAGVASAWISEHIAIPPDDAEGSGGRYLDPLTTLGWMAGQTRTIRLGTSVLILPYRPALPTAKAIATLQELSGGRLLLGVGIGWMQAEFDALGIERAQRGRTTDDMLRFLRKCFANDIVEQNGQPFLFKPRPPRPPIFIGGGAPHAVERALTLGDGWMPMGRPDALAEAIRDYRARAAERGHPGLLALFVRWNPDDPDGNRARLEQCADAGATTAIVSMPYNDAEDWLSTLAALQRFQS